MSRLTQSLALKKPASLSFEAAATIPVAFLTAYYGLHHLAQLRPGERVLIHAASGGVGMAAIQIARTLGAEIHATASPSKWDVLRELGISNLYHSRTLDFADQILAATNGAGVDVVLNSLSGEAIPQSFRALSPSGRFVEIGKRGIWTDEQVAAVRPGASYFSGDLGEGSVKIPEVLRSLLEEVVAKFDEGTFTELPVTCFPIAKAREAFRLMQQARHVGKIVMTLPVPSLKSVTCDPTGTYLVTGAFGGLGQVIARWLVEKGARNLALVSLRGAREEHEAFLTEISRTAKVRAITADLSRRDEVVRVLDEIELELPPLKGIIHAAGVLADGVLQKQSWDRFEQVIGAKAMSAWHLTELTLGKDLDFFVEFSSVAAVLGNAGQSNYAAANAFLDGLAHFRRGLGVPGLSINWGGWSEVGMAARQMEGYWVSNEMIAPRQGTQILEQLLSRPEAQVAVIPFNWVSYLQQYPINAEPPYLSVMAREVQQQREGNEQGSILRQQLRRASGARRHEMLLEYMQDLVAKLLRLEATQRPDATQALSDLGLDSLMGIQLKNRIRAELGVDVPIEEFVESPSIGQLASLLVELVGEMEVEDSDLVDNMSPLLRTERTGEIPASFAQQRLWYLEQLDAELPFYNLSFGLEFTGRIETGVMKRAIAEIVRRHETLRTTFKVVDGLPMPAHQHRTRCSPEDP
jgi:myxalamid-type polyketide synthase MxaB